MFIAVFRRNGIPYANLMKEAKDKNGNLKEVKVAYLGRVLDLKKGIFKSRERGIFTYDARTDTYGKAPADFVGEAPASGQLKEQRRSKTDSKAKNDVQAVSAAVSADSTILNFGDTFVLRELLRQTGLDKRAGLFAGDNHDTLLTLLMFCLESKLEISQIAAWYEGNVVCRFYPQAKLSEDGIMSCLEALGNQRKWLQFFRFYLPKLKKDFAADSVSPAKNLVMLDLTGLPADGKFPVSGLTYERSSSYDDEDDWDDDADEDEDEYDDDWDDDDDWLDDEYSEDDPAEDADTSMTMLCVLEQHSALPVVLSYRNGTRDDFLAGDLAERLARPGLQADIAVLSDHYDFPSSYRELSRTKIPFVVQLSEHNSLFGQLVRKHEDKLDTYQNRIRFDDTDYYVKRVAVQLKGGRGAATIPAHAYLIRDIVQACNEVNQTYDDRTSDRFFSKEIDALRQKAGISILVSSEKMTAEEILSRWNVRKQAGQIFGFRRNRGPVRREYLRSSLSVYGYIMLSFMAGILRSRLQQILTGMGIQAEEALQLLSGQHCICTDNSLMPCKLSEKAGKIYDRVQLTCPAQITLTDDRPRRGRKK